MPEAVGQQVPECRKQDSSNERFLVRSLSLCVAARRYRIVAFEESFAIASY